MNESLHCAVRRSRILAGVILLLAGWCAVRAPADYPPVVNFTEMTPPTEQEWAQLYLRRQMRRVGLDCCPKSVLLYGEILYFPCPADQPCGEPLHRSFRGTYGIRHPMPYYIPARRIEVEDPACCRSCGHNPCHCNRQSRTAILEIRAD